MANQATLSTARSGDQIEKHQHDIEESWTQKNESSCMSFSSRVYPTGFWPEFKGNMSLAWALIVTQVSQILFQPIATMFGGHLGKLELDAIALSNTLINVLGNSIVVGFASCLETVLSQSYGMENYTLLGTYLQRGIILHILLLMPCYALFLNIKPILLAIGQSPEVVELTSQYLLYFMPGMFFLFMWTALKKFTECQNIVWPHTIIAFMGHGIHALLQYLLLYQFNYGTMGSSIAQSTTFFALFVITLIYTMCSKGYNHCWNGWSKSCLLDWGSLTSLGLYGVLMLCLEWWAFEISILLAGTLGETELGAQSVTFNLESLYFGIPSGIAFASSIRVGQFLGAAKRMYALNAARVGMTITATNSVIWVILFVTASSELPKLFTEDREIINLVSQLMPFVAAYIFFGAFSVVGRAVCRGIGRQKWGTIVIFVSFYVFALPIAIPVTLLTSFGIRGTWAGFTIALFVSGSIFFVIINFLLDWEKLEREALERSSGKNATSGEEEVDEKKPLIRDTSSTSMDNVDVPAGVYMKRFLTIITFLLLPAIGIVIRLTTDVASSSSQNGNNSTESPLTNVTSLYQLT